MFADVGLLTTFTGSDREQLVESFGLTNNGMK